MRDGKVGRYGNGWLCFFIRYLWRGDEAVPFCNDML
jgi:hypothetical protein